MSTQPPTHDSYSHPLELFRRVVEDGFTRADLAVIDEIVSLHIAEHQSGMGAGPEGVKRAISYLHSVFPDFTLTIEDATLDGDKVWARLRARGTQRGPHMGMPATGRQIDVDVIDICRFENGLMVEHWGVPNRFTILEQLGLLPNQKQAERPTA